MAIRRSARFALMVLAGLALGSAIFPAPAPPTAPAEPAAQAAGIPADRCFYARSLHFTNAGIAYWYAKDQGGIERITGKPIAETGCLSAKCHVRDCDTCHRINRDGKAAYTTDRLRLRAACARCHPVDPADADVHFRRQMACLDCHTAREIHGDGTAWNTYMQPGALETRCETCHAQVGPSRSHTVHGDKLECVTCHTKEFPTCFNCHLGTRFEKHKDVQIMVTDMLFLVNRGGRVTTANFLSYVYGDKTMITLAPYFPHSVQKQGRACNDCHGTPAVAAVRDGTLRLAEWKDGKLAHPAGVIPVAEGMAWNLVFLDYHEDKDGAEGTWTPLARPEKPLVNFAGWCTPLSREQLGKLEKPVSGK